MKIAIASDHAGFKLKQQIAELLIQMGFDCENLGTHSENSCDYPYYGAAAAKAVSCGQCQMGIVICGTGIGISIVANKIKGIRCALCSEPVSAALSRQHNNTNMLALGARIIGSDLALEIVKTWLSTDFLGGRHDERIVQITQFEQLEQN